MVILVHFADDAAVRKLAKRFRPAPSWLYYMAGAIRPAEDRVKRITHHVLAEIKPNRLK